MGAVEFSIYKARKVQVHIAQRVISEDRLPREIKFVAGVDVAYHKGWAVGAALVLDYENLKVVETQIVIQKVVSLRSHPVRVPRAPSRGSYYPKTQSAA